MRNYTFMNQHFNELSMGFCMQKTLKERVGQGVLPEILLHDIEWGRQTIEYFDPAEVCSLEKLEKVFKHQEEYPELYAWVLTHPIQTKGEKWDWGDSEKLFLEDTMPRAYVFRYSSAPDAYVRTRYLNGEWDDYHYGCDAPDDEWYDDETANDLTIYWVEEGKEKEGRAGFNCSDNGSYITYEDNDYPGIVFDSIYANELPGGELQLLNIWEDMIAEAKSSEDGRINVTNVPLKDR